MGKSHSNCSPVSPPQPVQSASLSQTVGCPSMPQGSMQTPFSLQLIPAGHA